MSDPDDMLDAKELEYSPDLSSTNSDFEETQELKYSMDLSIFLLIIQKIQTPN